MYKSLSAAKDAYITNKVVNSIQSVSSNVGSAASLDLFKLYGVTKTNGNPNTELSRVLVKFDLEQLKNDVQNGLIDIEDDSFWCKISLKDVYGGQTTPSNFNISVYPLSASFDEGLGKDVVFYSDKDACNWLTSSLGNTWFSEGCNLDTDALSPGDYITSSVDLPTTLATQFFKSGTEDLFIDVTNIISSTLAGNLPDEGFRISFDSNAELNEQTYFVKRFGSRHAYNESKRPALIYGFDDSISDDYQNLEFDTSCKLNLYTFVKGQVQNIFSSSAEITGSNCLILKLSTEYPAPSSSYSYDLYFTGSQYSKGKVYFPGIYTSDVNVDSLDSVVSAKIQESGSVNFHLSWMSNDLTVTYATGDDVLFSPPIRTNASNNRNRFQVNALGTNVEYSKNEDPVFRVNISDYRNPLVKVVKLPVELPGIVLKDVHYSIRNAATNEVVIPFDTTKNSTKVSSDSSGMFFKLYTSALSLGKTYVVDIMISLNGNKTVFSDASAAFRIV